VHSSVSRLVPPKVQWPQGARGHAARAATTPLEKRRLGSIYRSQAEGYNVPDVRQGIRTPHVIRQYLGDLTGRCSRQRKLLRGPCRPFVVTRGTVRLTTRQAESRSWPCRSRAPRNRACAGRGGPTCSGRRTGRPASSSCCRTRRTCRS